MGTDIESTTVVLVDIDDIAGVFNSAKLAKAFAGYCAINQQRLMMNLTKDGRIIVANLEDEDEQSEDRGEINERLSHIQTGRDLYDLLRDLCFANQSGEVGKYSNTWFENNEGLTSLLNAYLFIWGHYSGVQLPAVDDMLTFGSGRNCGWAVHKYGHPYISYAVSDVFEQRLTSKGASLQKALGIEVSTTTYTTVSY